MQGLPEDEALRAANDAVGRGEILDEEDLIRRRLDGVRFSGGSLRVCHGGDKGTRRAPERSAPNVLQERYLTIRGVERMVSTADTRFAR